MRVGVCVCVSVRSVRGKGLPGALHRISSHTDGVTDEKVSVKPEIIYRHAHTPHHGIAIMQLNLWIKHISQIPDYNDGCQIFIIDRLLSINPVTQRNVLGRSRQSVSVV